MKVFQGFGELPLFERGTVVAIGNFDGFHLGHRRIIARLTGLARRKKLFSLVLTFFPPPVLCLNLPAAPLIQTLSQRIESFRESGVQGVLVISLGKKLASLSGRAFARDILKKRLRAEDIVVGENFRFGKSRLSGVGELRAYGREFGFEIQAIAPVVKQDLTVSSSRIRSLIAKGRVGAASKFLGHPFEIEGRVVKGRARGIALGFPTANLRTDHEILPPGVFLTETRIGRSVWPSLTNIGIKPTFGRNPVGVETHVLRWHGDLYGRILKIRFLKKLRNERRFKTPDNLVKQINNDLRRAVRYFGRSIKRPFAP